MKKAKADHTPRKPCEACAGEGCTWSEATLQKWDEETPWFDRERLSPPPPHSWRDRNCDRCQGAGYLNAETGEPYWARLVPSARPRNAKTPRRRSRR